MIEACPLGVAAASAPALAKLQTLASRGLLWASEPGFYRLTDRGRRCLSANLLGCGAPQKAPRREVADGTTGVDVSAVVSSSIVWNRRHDVTGMLVASARNFAQAIEGRPDDIELVLERIRSDPRHHTIHVQVEEPGSTRLFARWGMGFVAREDLSDELGRLHGGDRPRGERMATLNTLVQGGQDFTPEL